MTASPSQAQQRNCLASAVFASILLLLLLVATMVPVVHATPRSADAPFTVFGYLPEYRLRGYNYEAAFQTGLTHLIYFSLEIDLHTALPSAMDRLPTTAEAQDARRAADKTGGKILLGFGGNARSQGFPNMVIDPANRKKFLTALNALLVEYQMDGVDYNWEYPQNAEQWQVWGTLMQESKAFLLGGPSKNVVTFTMYMDPNHYNVIRHFDLLRHADFVHCMVYDQHGQHSTYDFAMTSIQHAKQHQLPLRKFTLGVPFYARHTQTGDPKTYQEVWRQLMKKNKQNATAVPRDVDLLGKYYFNSQEMIRKKTTLAVDSGLGGVMIWELGQDEQPASVEHSLMRAIAQITMPSAAALPAEVVEDL